jgi:hypothetical protein
MNRNPSWKNRTWYFGCKLSREAILPSESLKVAVGHLSVTRQIKDLSTETTGLKV